MGRLAARLHGFVDSPKNRLLILFGIEGILYQFVSSVAGFGNNLYATNLGATDTQIGLIQTVPNLVAVALLLPSGILSERMRRSRTMPVAVLCVMGVMYLGYGTVPAMGANRMGFFFLFLGMTAGLTAIYNAQWQNFFGDVVALDDRNGVYTFRNRFMFFIGTLTPLLCGVAMSAVSHPEQKLLVLRIFYYISGVFLLVQAAVIAKIPCAERNADSLPRFSPRDIGRSIKLAAQSPSFRGFFGVILFFYLSWHLDWSMWYLAQVQYVGLSEAQMSYYNALVCVTQLAAIGLFAKLNQKKTVHFTIIFGCLGLVICPIAVLVSCALPIPYRPWVFIAIGVMGGIPQSCLSLCIVQMLLEAAPEKNRPLIISLYTIVITLSNSFLPLLGVKLYTVLGADLQALRLFNLLAAGWRTLAMGLFILRYRKMKRQNTLIKQT